MSKRVVILAGAERTKAVPDLNLKEEFKARGIVVEKGEPYSGFLVEMTGKQEQSLKDDLGDSIVVDIYQDMGLI